MSYEVWICDACDEIVSLRRVGESGFCAGSLTMGTAHERQAMRAAEVEEWKLDHPQEAGVSA